MKPQYEPKTVQQAIIAYAKEHGKVQEVKPEEPEDNSKFTEAMWNLLVELMELIPEEYDEYHSGMLQAYEIDKLDDLKDRKKQTELYKVVKTKVDNLKKEAEKSSYENGTI